MGLNQNYYIKKDLLLSASYEKQRTFKSDLSDSSKDFTAYSLGLNYRHKDWIYDLKGEYRESDSDKKINLDFNSYTNFDSDIGFLFAYNHRGEFFKDRKTILDSINLSSAYRTNESFILLDKLKLSREKRGKVDKDIALLRVLSKIKASDKNLFYASYAIKYLKESIEDRSYDSLIDIFGFEYIYQLNRLFEIGVNTSLYHLYSSEDFKDSIGAFLGFNIFKNLYLGIGYNFMGYSDYDFDRFTQRDRGLFLNFKIKFDKEGLEDIVKSF